MKFKELWVNILRSGAILGVIMALSHIFEHHVMVFGHWEVFTSTLLAYGEGVVVFALYVWLLYRHTRSVAKAWNPDIEMSDGSVRRIEFSYGKALSFALLASMCAGIIVGLAHTLYVDYMGFDIYVRGLISRIEELRAMPDAMQQNMDLLDDVVKDLEAAQNPSIFSNIVSYINQYMFMGLIPGLAIAALARRNVKRDNGVK